MQIGEVCNIRHELFEGALQRFHPFTPEVQKWNQVQSGTAEEFDGNAGFFCAIRKLLEYVGHVEHDGFDIAKRSSDGVLVRNL